MDTKMNFSKDKAVILAVLLILAVIVVAAVGASKKKQVKPAQNQQEEVKHYDLYSRSGKIKKIEANGDLTVTFTGSEVVGGVARAVYTDKTVKINEDTKFYSMVQVGNTIQKELKKTDLAANKDVVIYSTDDIERTANLTAVKIDIK